MQITLRLEGLADFRNMVDERYQITSNYVDEAVERRALLIVNDIKSNAPRLTGRLANSFDIVPQYTRLGERAIGSEIEYAQRQEYEHATKKGFVRNTVTNHEPYLENDLRDAVQRGLEG